MDEHVGAVREPARIRLDPDVTPELLDAALEPGVVERREVEDPHVVTVGDEAPGEMQAEKACAAGDRDEHEARKASARHDRRPRPATGSARRTALVLIQHKR